MTSIKKNHLCKTEYKVVLNINHVLEIMVAPKPSNRIIASILEVAGS